MIPHRFEKFLEDLVFLVETGEISMSRIDDAVERILRVKFISGVFEHPFSDPSLLDVVGCKVACMFAYLCFRCYCEIVRFVLLFLSSHILVTIYNVLNCLPFRSIGCWHVRLYESLWYF